MSSVTITKEPVRIILMENPKKGIYKEHYPLIRSFYDDNAILKLTVKDIKLRYEEITKKKKSLQTLYRWIDVLKTENILLECGYKITPHEQSKQGRITETLYCPAAEVFFFKDIRIEDRWFNQEDKIKKYANGLNQILPAILGPNLKDKNAKDGFYKIVQKYEEDKIKVVQNIVSTANEKKEILNAYLGLNETEIANLNRVAADLISMVKNPDLISYLQNFQI